MNSVVSSPRASAAPTQPSVRARRTRTTKPSRLTGCILIGVFLQSVIISVLAILQHRQFGSWGFDLAIYDQAWWLVSRDGVSAASFITMRGMPVWGHHVNGVFVLLAPFARLGFGPEFLIAFQAFSLALGALPISWLARTKTGSARLGAAIGFMYLLYPAVTWAGWISFHPEVLAVTPLLFSAWFAHTRRYGSLAACIVLALICREEVGLVVSIFGFVWLVQTIARNRNGNRNHTDVIAAFLTGAVGISWFLLCSKVIIPAVLGSDVYYVDQFYAQYGSTMSEVAVHLATHPGTMASLATQPQARTYLLDLFGPLGFLPLLGAPVLTAAPQLVAAIAANSKWVRDVRFQYTALMVPGIFLGAVDALSRVVRRSSRAARVVVGWMLLCTCLSAFVRGPLPGSAGFSNWKLHDPAKVSLDRAVAMIPADAGVAAQDNIAPHLSHRRQLFDFPNPFERMSYGPPSAPPASETLANWIVLQPESLSPKYRPVYDRLINGGVFKVVFNENGVVVAKRA